MSWQPPVGDPEVLENPNAALAEADVTLVGPDIETDEAAMRTQVYENLRQRVPGWEPHDGNLETWLTEDYTSIAAEIRSLCASVPEAIFMTYAEEILGIPARVPTPALGHATITAIDDQGYSLAAGTEIILRRTGDELVAFSLVNGAVIEPGQTQVEDVDIAAVIPGAASNGLSGRAEPAEHLAWIESIEVPRATYGGDDGQDQAAFIAAIAVLLQLVAIRPILPFDFAALVLLRIVGIGRAIAMDGYNPNAKTWENPRTITILVTDFAGEPVDPDLRRKAREMLESLREVNWKIFVLDTDYSAPINISYAVTPFAEQDPEIIKGLCDTAIGEYLSSAPPTGWRLGMTSPSIAAGEVILPPRGGRNPGGMTVRINEIIGRLDRVRGVDWVDSVKIDGGNNDRVLEGPTTLPRLGNLTGVVNAQ